jgi:hypothetical protein
LTVGTTDRAKHFHPFGLALCSHQDTDDFHFLFKSIKDAALLVHAIDYNCDILIADNAKEITNGFTLTFGPPRKRINCWAHVFRCIEKNLVTVKDLAIRNAIKQDIRRIQTIPDMSVISTVFKLFDSKWRSRNIPAVTVFLEYFSNWTREGQNGWIEGYCLGKPSQSNSIEATHTTMKTKFEHHKK